MKQLICTNCKQTNTGINTETNQRRCLTCLGTTFEEIELPDELSCRYCKKTSKTEELLKQWKKIPFLDMKNKTYYCGCRGWD